MYNILEDCLSYGVQLTCNNIVGLYLVFCLQYSRDNDEFFF